MPERRPPRRVGPAAPRARRPVRGAPAANTSWDALARWYDGWVGEGGSHHHQQVAVPAVLRLLAPRRGERILDVGAGQGVLAAPISAAGAVFVGVDASPRLLDMARDRHGKDGTFVLGDARRLARIGGMTAASFDAVVFLLSLQDMDPLEDVIASAAWALKPGGRIVILLTHPAFRVPRQSGWGYDEGRKLVYRRVDRYRTPLPVPLKPYPGGEGVTRSFHRPLEAYVNTLGANGLFIDRMEELAGVKLPGMRGGDRAEEMARREIPLFLALRAYKLGHALAQLNADDT